MKPTPEPLRTRTLALAYWEKPDDSRFLTGTAATAHDDPIYLTSITFIGPEGSKRAELRLRFRRTVAECGRASEATFKAVTDLMRGKDIKGAKALLEPNNANEIRYDVTLDPEGFCATAFRLAVDVHRIVNPGGSNLDWLDRLVIEYRRQFEIHRHNMNKNSWISPAQLTILQLGHRRIVDVVPDNADFTDVQTEF
jgi:hypothetical protein